MQIQGKIIVALPEQGGISQKGNQWSRRDYVLETLDKYPKKVSFSVFNEKIGELGGLLLIGSTVVVDIDIDAREYNGRWFNSITAWKVAPFDVIEPNQPQAYAQPMPTQAPYPQQPMSAPRQATNPYGEYSRPTSKPVPDGAADDLPF